MSTISTHVLDTALGKPAAGVPVTLERATDDTVLGSGATDTDGRFRDLCSRHIPRVREHQRMLEEYQTALGAEAGEGKKILGAMLGKARDLADSARESDFLRLVGDIVMSRQAEDTFKTFRDGGRALGNTQLAQIGEMGERHHDEYNREANRLVQLMFIEHVRGVEPGTAQDQISVNQGTVGA